MNVSVRALKNRCCSFMIVFASIGSGSHLALAQIDQPMVSDGGEQSTDDESGLIEQLELQGSGTLGQPESRNHQCRQYSGYAHLCQQAVGCTYDYRSNICHEGGAGGGGFGVCQRFNYDYRQCVNAGCMFDGQTGSCYGSGYPAPRPQPPYPQPIPNYCGQYNYNQYQCQSAGCFYDHRNGACFANGQPYPQPSQPPFRFTCTAVDAGFEEHGGGHRGIGRNQYEAQQSAMGDCLRHHGQCRVTNCRQQ